MAKTFATGSYWFTGAPMAAAQATIETMLETDGIAHLERVGSALREGWQRAADSHGVGIRQTGPVSIPLMTFDGDDFSTRGSRGRIASQPSWPIAACTCTRSTTASSRRRCRTRMWRTRWRPRRRRLRPWRRSLGSSNSPMAFDEGEDVPSYERVVFPPRVRNALFVEQRGRCRYCGRRMSNRQLEIDHKWPVSRNGGNELSNLQLLCTACNLRKGIQTDGEFRDRYWRLLPPDGTIPDPPIGQDEFTKQTQYTRASPTVRGIYRTASRLRGGVESSRDTSDRAGILLRFPRDSCWLGLQSSFC